MSPSIITEANQPLTARSTVAQRKQANELRKVRRTTECAQTFLFSNATLLESSRITTFHNFF